MTLTAAGERLLPAAEELLRRLQIARADASNAAQSQQDAMKLAATHVLSFTFFPIWLRSVEAVAPMTGTIQLMSDTMVACERVMIEGRADFLLCHNHPAVPTRLTPESFRSIEIGQDVLVPVATPRLLETCEPDSPPYLAYTAESQPGRVLAAAWASTGQHPPRKPAFSSPLVSVLAAMARDGHGMSWSPLSLVAEDIAAGRLARVTNVAAEVSVGIRLFRPKSRQSPAAETFWKQAVTASSDRARPGEALVCPRSAVEEILHC